MKTAALALLLGAAAAIPTDYAAPPGGYETIDYPDGTGENLPYYPPPPGGWENVNYPPGTGAGHPGYPTNPPPADCKPPREFTAEYTIIALGSEVVNGTGDASVSTPGPDDAVGIFKYQIDGPGNTICYDITLVNVEGDYRSPARTATHIHEAPSGRGGPPRIAFPNPEGDDRVRFSKGCLTGPFTTGINATDGTDTGAGFRVQEIVDSPASFFTDSHTALFVPGVVRGQFA